MSSRENISCILNISSSAEAECKETSSVSLQAVEKLMTPTHFLGHIVKHQLYAFQEGYYSGALVLGSLLAFTGATSPLLLLSGFSFNDLICGWGFTAIPLAATTVIMEIGRGTIDNLVAIHDAVYPGGDITIDWGFSW